MKIMISGPTGSGKTTLASDLANHFGIPLVPEGMADIYAAKNIYQTLRKSQPGNKQEITNAYVAWINSFRSWRSKRSDAYKAHPKFVADRWEADLLSVWLRLFSRKENDATTKEMFLQMRKVSSFVDAIVFLPALQTPIEEKNEEGLVRVDSFSVRLKSMLLTHGLIRQCNATRCIYVPDKPMTREERLNLVAGQITTFIL